MTLELLLKLMPPPTHPIETGTAEEWPKIEQALGIELPQDYKDFVSTYGTGQISGIVWVYNPFSSNRYLNLANQASQRPITTLGILASTGEELKVEYPYPLYPEPDGLLRWGTTDNGDELYWQTTGDPNQWPVVTNEVRGTGFAKFRETMTNFVVKVILGEIKSEVLPTKYLARNKHFDVYNPNRLS